MRSICFYFQVHQPFRLRTYRFFDIGQYHDYFDEYRNRYILRRVADKCYLPMNQLLLDLIHEYGSAFKVSFSLSGTVIDQFERYTPDVIESFKRLAETGSVEFIAETYSHSLSSLKSKTEFKKQVEAQVAKVRRHFGQNPTTFRNTELIYSDGIGAMVAELGFKTMLTEGAKHVLGWKSPNFIYCNAINPRLKILLKNFRLSDDLAFRFSQQSWDEWPLTTEKYVDWLNAVDPSQECVNLFMDYETFGEHQWKETGIFEFMRALPSRVFSHSDFTFNTPSELSEHLQPVAEIHVPHPISWADEERDLTAWLGNELQDDAFAQLYDLESLVNSCTDEQIQQEWKYLQTSDHFYYMCTKWFSDGDVHKYFNPYNTPYEAYINFMNILSDFRIRLEKYTDGKPAAVPAVKKSPAKAKKKATAVAKRKSISAGSAGKTASGRQKTPVKTAANAKKDSVRKSSGTIKKQYHFRDVLKLNKTQLRSLLHNVSAGVVYAALDGSDARIRKTLVLHLGRNPLREYNALAAKAIPVSDEERDGARNTIASLIGSVIK